MHIENWSLHFYELPYRQEVVWANAVETSGLYALLRLQGDDGSVGLAEGTIKATWSGVSPRSLKATFTDLLMPLLLGRDVSAPGAISQVLAQIPENRLAKGMLESACWMLRVASQDLPLWQFLGGRQQVSLTWTVTRQRPSVMARDAEAMVHEHGIHALKVKGGQGLTIDRDAIRRVRAAVGDAIILNVDANSAYRPDEAAAYVSMLADEGVSVAEDPCPLQPDAAFEALQRTAAIPILVDRSCTTASDAHLYLERGARALSAKPGRIGMTEVLAINELAAQHGAQVATGIYAESALGSLINLQQAAAVAPALSLMPAEQMFFLTLTEQVIAQPIVIRQGHVELPADPEPDRWVDWDKVRRFGQHLGV